MHWAETQASFEVQCKALVSNFLPILLLRSKPWGQLKAGGLWEVPATGSTDAIYGSIWQLRNAVEGSQLLNGWVGLHPQECLMKHVATLKLFALKPKRDRMFLYTPHHSLGRCLVPKCLTCMRRATLMGPSPIRDAEIGVETISLQLHRKFNFTLSQTWCTCGPEWKDAWEKFCHATLKPKALWAKYVSKLLEFTEMLKMNLELKRTFSERRDFLVKSVSMTFVPNGSKGKQYGLRAHLHVINKTLYREESPKQRRWIKPL